MTRATSHPPHGILTAMDRRTAPLALLPPLLAGLLLAVLLAAGCSSTPESQERVREDTARTTATIKSDVKAAAQGIRDGLRQNTSAAPDRLDINTATQPELQRLPGITPALAGRIVAHRPYGAPTDLTRRHVLTASEYNSIASRITATR
ncbi:MAG: helix-hairpin-helix domain-containing protein [Acidobacteriota bacterium]|nr:helix-hairpin-helix domain-containing protein [Acidobacteriota bacterium]